MMYAFTAMTLLGISHFLFFWVMTEPKYSRSKTALIYSGFVVLFVSLTTLIYTVFGKGIGYFSTAFMSTIVVAFLIFLFASADPTCKKVFLFISYANAFCIFVCISLMLCKVLFKGAPDIFVYYARNIVRTVLFLPMAYVYVRFLRPSVREVSGQRRKTWYSISTVSFLFLVIFALFVIIFYDKYERIGDYALFFAVSVLIYASILWVIFGTIKSMIDESNTELINQNIAYLQGQLKTAKENELSAKTVRHDFRHHNQNIETMLKKGEVDEALCYLKQYNDSLDEIKPNDFCPNITVNAILNSFYTNAQKNGLSISVEADTAENIAISDMDFVAVLSNILENAVNGCIECQSDGKITVNIRTIANKIVIVCSNPCRHDICIENNMLKNRGIGIAGILSAIRKYDGDIKYSYENNILTVCIILNF